MQILILGDVHLGAGLSLGKVGLGTNLNSRINDQIALLDWTLEKAIENHVSDIFITGDIFEDPKANFQLISIFISWLKRCQNHTKVHIIVGNHDILRSGNYYISPLDIIAEADLENIFVYKNISTVLLDTTAFTLVPFLDRKSLGVNSNIEALGILKNLFDYEISSIPKSYKKIMIGHLAIEGSIFVGDEIDDVANELLCPTNMFGDYDHVWMGHVHKHQVFSNEPYISHIGSMDVSNFGDQNEKIIVIYDTSTNEFFHEILPTKKLNKISLSIPKEKNPTDFLLEELKNNNLKNSYLKIEINLESGEESVDRKKIEEFLLDKNLSNLIGISETKKSNKLKKETSEITTNMNIDSAIKEYAEKFISKEEQSDFLELASKIYKENLGNL
jgi:DNA repair protein SbcD/Mre11